MRTFFLLAAALSWVGCGASETAPAREATDVAVPESEAVPATGRTPASPVREDATGSGPMGMAGEPTGEEVQYGADPRLSVYVAGPRPVAGQSGVDATAGAYQTEVTVVNQGDAAAEIERARVWMEVWDGDERLPCSQQIGRQWVEGPPLLEPGEAHRFQAVQGCPVPGAGEYEVRAYLTFGAEADAFDIERHYAGRYEMAVDE